MKRVRMDVVQPKEVAVAAEEAVAKLLFQRFKFDLKATTLNNIRLSPRRVYMSRETLNVLSHHNNLTGNPVVLFKGDNCNRIGRVCGYLVYEEELPLGVVSVEYCKSVYERDDVFEPMIVHLPTAGYL